MSPTAILTVSYSVCRAVLNCVSFKLIFWDVRQWVVSVYGTHLELMSLSSELEFLPLSPHQYGIVLDAGSSHTALYIYRWPAEKVNDTGRAVQVHSCKVKGIHCTMRHVQTYLPLKSECTTINAH